MIAWRRLAFLILPVCGLATGRAADPEASFAAVLRGRQAAVVVFPQASAVTGSVSVALVRLEQILRDNGITPLSAEKRAQLMDSFATLDDPAVFVTAEDFLKQSERLAIEGLVALYLKGQIVPGLADYATATAHAEVRFIGEQDAVARAFSTPAMGIPGQPPSDGLTPDSAMVNAVQRAVDLAARRMGLVVPSPIPPSTVDLALAPMPAPATMPERGGKPLADPALARLARLDNEGWRKEQVTHVIRAPAGGLGAVAGYIVDTDFHRKPPRLFGSRLHIVDLEGGKELGVFECHPVEKSARAETGTRQVLDVAFIGSWRYVAALTGNALFVWDVERGRVIAETALPKPLSQGGLWVNLTPTVSLIAHDGRRPVAAWRITRRY